MPHPKIPASILLTILLTSGLSAQDRSHARSMVITRYGIVATSHVQASAAGAQILAKGGSARGPMARQSRNRHPYKT